MALLLEFAYPAIDDDYAQFSISLRARISSDDYILFSACAAMPLTTQNGKLLSNLRSESMLI